MKLFNPTLHFEGTEMFCFQKSLRRVRINCRLSETVKTEASYIICQKELKANNFDCVYIFQYEVKPTPSWRYYNLPLPNRINPKRVKSKMILNYICKSWLSPD